MKNKNLLLLPLLLLLPATLYTMEISNINSLSKSSTVIIYDIKKLLKRHDKLISELQNYQLSPKIPYHKKHCSQDLLDTIPHLQALNKTLNSMDKKTTTQRPCGMVSYVHSLQFQRHVKAIPPLTLEPDKYSFLGFATMSIKNSVPCNDISYKEKDERIKSIYQNGYNTLTNKDLELAFVEKWKRCTPTIIKKISLPWYCSEFLPEFPQELKNYMAKLTFWSQFNAKKSLL